jgi:hypothetical protein
MRRSTLGSVLLPKPQISNATMARYCGGAATGWLDLPLVRGSFDGDSIVLTRFRSLDDQWCTLMLP